MLNICLSCGLEGCAMSDCKDEEGIKSTADLKGQWDVFAVTQDEVTGETLGVMLTYTHPETKEVELVPASKAEIFLMNSGLLKSFDGGDALQQVLPKTVVERAMKALVPG